MPYHFTSTLATIVAYKDQPAVITFWSWNIWWPQQRFSIFPAFQNVNIISDLSINHVRPAGLSGHTFLSARCPLLASGIFFSALAESQLALKIAKKNWSHLHSPHGRAPFQHSIARGQSLSTLNLESTAGLGQSRSPKGTSTHRNKNQ